MDAYDTASSTNAQLTSLIDSRVVGRIGHDEAWDAVGRNGATAGTPSVPGVVRPGTCARS